MARCHLPLVRGYDERMNQTHTTPMGPLSFIQGFVTLGVVCAGVAVGVCPGGFPATASESLATAADPLQADLAGFQVIGWGNVMDAPGGLGRLRYTGAPLKLPQEIVPTKAAA